MTMVPYPLRERFLSSPIILMTPSSYTSDFRSFENFGSLHMCQWSIRCMWSLGMLWSMGLLHLR